MPSLAYLVDLSAEEQEARGLLHTPREIAQQPDSWKTTLAIFRQMQASIADFLTSCGVRGPLEQRPVVLLVGAGTSDYIGQTLALLLQQQWGCVVMAYASTDLLINLEEAIVPGRPYLCISFSRSGDSPEGVAVLERALERYPEVANLVITCNADGRMAQIVQQASRGFVIVLDNAVNDRSLAMTSSFTNMVIMGQCLAHAWSLEEYVPVHAALIAAGERMLEQAAQEAHRIAGSGLKRACFVGSGARAGAARESALKVLELTAGQVKTMSETLLGLRHGPMAALDSETLFVCFVPGDGSKTLYARELLAEISAKGITRERICVGASAAMAEVEPFCDVCLSMPGEIADVYYPVIDVLFGQLLGMFCSVALGLKPDAPSPGGVISRVVSKFEIH